MSALDDRTTERLLAGRAVEDEPGLTAFFEQLQQFVPATTPAVPAALEDLFAGGLAVAPPSTAPTAPQRPRWWSAVSWSRVVTAGAAVVGVVLGAGAANALPSPAQQVVADVVGWFSPLDLPRPDGRRDDVEGPGPATSPTPSGSGTTPVLPVPPPSGSHDGTSTPRPVGSPVAEAPDEDDAGPARSSRDEEPVDTTQPAPEQPDDGEEASPSPVATEEDASDPGDVAPDTAPEVPADSEG